MPMILLSTPLSTRAQQQMPRSTSRAYDAFSRAAAAKTTSSETAYSNQARGQVIRREYQKPEYRGNLSAEQKLEKRSYDVFPHAILDADENAKRVLWIVEQEQRAFMNEINRGKPLLYPVTGK
jgi:hypothetical protein